MVYSYDSTRVTTLIFQRNIYRKLQRDFQSHGHMDGLLFTQARKSLVKQCLVAKNRNCELPDSIYKSCSRVETLLLLCPLSRINGGITSTPSQALFHSSMHSALELGFANFQKKNSGSKQLWICYSVPFMRDG